jgi:uncharacterized protein (DUF305 family)
LSLAGDIVDGVMRAITGSVEMTAAAREAAKESVRATLAAVAERDQRETVSVRADDITSRHLARVAKVANAVVPIGTHAAHVEELIGHATMPESDRESIMALIAHARGEIPPDAFED